MDLLESVKRFLEDEDGENESTIDSLPAKFIEPIVGQGLKVDLVERGRLICSLKVPPRLVDDSNRLHGGAMATLLDLLSSTVFHTVELGTFHSGVSVEINISFVDVAVLGEEIEIDSKVLSVGKMICVASVELRKKETGKIIAQGRHTKYLGIGSSKL
ncbi:acyl-coenzyme A thioesterase 13-like [Ipomoea triloba]|uniref:acyl-coenzyme A thioesterase 13-like n=1 Tax=Ipomoea triloba TaxID=35885 RepID=UPI00125D1EDF|nr:acyl-coenzyme A thioesterase 13-like [Ipomoea triloba]GMD58471.1 acyl-coenzyme A thioesterase 13 [Ipomoea batatas]